jgi:hypothetical protein
MAHYAFLKENIVTEVITGIDETELIGGLDPETWYSNFRGQKCLRTSYNGRIRYNYAGIGYTYDEEADAFIAPRPECGHKELFLNDTFQWNCQGCEIEFKKIMNEA